MDLIKIHATTFGCLDFKIKILFNSTSNIHRSHFLNPSATSFFLENLASQINYESPSFDEYYPFENNDNFCKPYHNNALPMTS